MYEGFDYKGNKGFRLLKIYERLNKGESLKKKDLIEDFGVTSKTIQRDLDDLRAYISENHQTEEGASVKYDKKKDVYYLVKRETEWLTNEEILALCKVILESRALCRDELNVVINKLKNQVAPGDRKRVQSMIQSEQHYYVPLQHNQPLLTRIWELSEHIVDQEIISLKYKRQDGVESEREVEPVAIMFSEYYFYLAAYMVTNKEKSFPTIYRLDRIAKIEGTGKKFKVAYKERFNEGEFRKRIQFMYAGELRKIKLSCRKSSVEAVLDRLPTAEVKYIEDERYIIEAEVYGNGVDMWIRSQGDYVKEL